MESADPQAPGGNVHHLLHPVAHFLGGFIGEGHRQDGRGRHLVHPHQPRHAVHQYAGFTTAGAGQYQQVIVLGGDRFTLGVVQGIDDVGNVHSNLAFYWLNKQVGEYNR